MSDEPEALSGVEDAGPARRLPPKRWPWVLGAVGVLMVLAVVAAAVVRLPYYTISPGSAVDVNRQIAIEGADQDRPRGEILLLFVRQRARVNALRWIQASLDPDVDLYREQTFTGGQSPEEVRDAAIADMAVAQYAAKVVALERLGYELPLERQGVRVLHVFESLPAHGVLRVGDVVVAVDGQPVRSSEALSKAIQEHEPGDAVDLAFYRRDRKMTETVRVAASEGDHSHAVIGVQIAPPYRFPVDIEIDTKDIGGPSAGLAMTLSIVDSLTPGELTGGSSVAVTGTIGFDGKVGPVGGVGQKALSALKAGATLFLVPRSEVAEARRRAGDALKIVGVDDLDDALTALERAGGDPVTEVQRDAA